MFASRHPPIDAFSAELWEDACEKKGFSEIHKIVWGISCEDLDTKVRACPEAVDGLDLFGNTPLDYAIRFGNSDHVRILLSHGADIGRRPHYLFWKAVESGNCASTQLLLDRGLRPHDLVLYSPEDNLDPFLYYIRHYEAYEPAMHRLLIDYGFDLNTGDSDGITALMACCRWAPFRNRVKGLEWLLEYGVDTEVTDKDGQTAIHHALLDDSLLQFKMLTKYGARLDARTSKGETVLHMAVQRTRTVEMVCSLFEAGIMHLDLDARLHGKTAFDFLRLRAQSDWPWVFDPPYGSHMPPFKKGDHVRIIRAFESLFQQIQEHQGVPLEDRYPPLPIAALGEVIAAESVQDTYSTSPDDASDATSDEDDTPADQESNEPICTPPGAWPE